MPHIPLFHNDGQRLSAALQEVQTTGAAFVKFAVPYYFVQALQFELSNGQFRRAQPSGDVRQEFEFFQLSYPMPDFLCTAWLGKALVHAVHQFCPAGSRLGDWMPNDIAVQRYVAGSSDGIEIHRDYRRDILLVAVFTLSSAAKFKLWKNDRQTVEQEWKILAGDLVLLRGPGLSEADGRRYHSIDPPYQREDRLSLAYRMNVSLPLNDPARS